MNIATDSRPAATFLAARLARTSQDRQSVRNTALRLLGSARNGDYWLVRALQQLNTDLEHDVPFLAKQGWELRSLAAYLGYISCSRCRNWEKHSQRTRDPRVRRSLATALAGADDDDRTNIVRQRLLNDPRFSVRTLLEELNNPGTSPTGEG